MFQKLTDKKKEIYTYEAPFTMYATSWSNRKDKPFRLCCGSFIEDYTNYIQIIQLNEKLGKFENTHTIEHPYPASKTLFHPTLDNTKVSNDLLATSGDYLRIWELKDNQKADLKSCLNTSKNSEFCAPLTSFDWNTFSPNILGTSSIDTTCTVWDIEKQAVITQLIAHDKEVFDIAFTKGKDIFASVGADGSLRMFDLRNLEHSTIVYESQNYDPLLRLSWNKQDTNYVATIYQDGSKIIILDIRVPSVPVVELDSHTAPVNSICWAPHSSSHLCSAGDDSQVLIWELKDMPKPTNSPALSYKAQGEVNQVSWSNLNPEWVSASFDKSLQILKI
eukprot:gene6391-10398_t